MNGIAQLIFNFDGGGRARRVATQRRIFHVDCAGPGFFLGGEKIATFHALFIRHENLSVANMEKVSTHHTPFASPHWPYHIARSAEIRSYLTVSISRCLNRLIGSSVRHLATRAWRSAATGWSG